MNSNLSTALISPNVLKDVNLLLGIDVHEGGAGEAYFLPPKPSPWEVAYILIQFASYAESLVFFDRVRFLFIQPIQRPLEDHISAFTYENDILQPITDDSILWRRTDNRYKSLSKVAQETLFPMKGFQGLFRKTKAYRNFDDNASEFCQPLFSPYWASGFIDYNFYANPIESIVAGYDSI
jgi:hypothetical protein